MITWHGLQVVIRVADEAQCQDLLQEELNGRGRLRHLLRIHSRLNRVRAERERKELEGEAKEP